MKIFEQKICIDTRVTSNVLKLQPHMDNFMLRVYLLDDTVNTYVDAILLFHLLYH